jgi:hypothetical protein
MVEGVQELSYVFSKERANKKIDFLANISSIIFQKPYIALTSYETSIPISTYNRVICYTK